MTGSIMVLPGSAGIDLLTLRRVAADFGWTAEVVYELCEAAFIEASRQIVAVLFSSDALGPGKSWLETIRALRLALPKLRLVACHSFTESIDWPELCDAGAFHALWLPLKEDEVRRTLGFIWAAESSLRVPLKTIPVSLPI